MSGPLARPARRAGSGGREGPLGRWTRHPAPSPTAAFQAERRMRSSRPVPLGPRQPAVPFPRRATLPTLTPCLPEGMFYGPSLSGTSNPDWPRDCSALASSRQDREVRSPFSRPGNRGLERRRDQPEGAPNALRGLEPRTRGHLVRGHPPLLVEGFGPNWEWWTQKRLSHCFLSYSPMTPAAPS